MLAALREELANLEQQSSELTTRWQNERDKIAAEGKIKEELDQARIELEQAQRAGDLAKAGELSYGKIPALEKRLSEASAQSENALLRERAEHLEGSMQLLQTEVGTQLRFESGAALPEPLATIRGVSSSAEEELQAEIAGYQAAAKGGTTAVPEGPDQV